MSLSQLLDLSTVLNNAPRNCWLALSDDETKIVGRGESIADAVKEAKKAGIEDPVVVWSPKTWIPRILEADREG
jgi:hypothetical protein